MLRRITELWPNLLRGNQEEREEVNQILADEDSPDEVTDQQMQELLQQNRELYKNDYWSRVVAADTHDPGESHRWRLAEDLSKEQEVLFNIDPDELQEIKPHFDPAEFVK